MKLSRQTWAAALLVAFLASVPPIVKGQDLEAVGEGSQSSSVVGDPVFTTFDGQVFEFHGEPGKAYNLISVAGEFMLSTKLKLGVMYDHNGTYMESITLRYQEASIVIDVDEVKAPHLNVLCGDVALQLGPTKAAAVKTLFLKDGSTVTVDFRTNVPELGTVVQLSTADMAVQVTLVEPHRDPGGVMQPYHLNSNISVSSVFEQDAEGILGESLNYIRDMLFAKDPSTIKRPAFPLKSDAGYEITNTALTIPAQAVYRVPAIIRRSMLGFVNHRRLGRARQGWHQELLTNSRAPFTASTFQR